MKKLIAIFLMAFIFLTSCNESKKRDAKFKARYLPFNSSIGFYGYSPATSIINVDSAHKIGDTILLMESFPYHYYLLVERVK